MADKIEELVEKVKSLQAQFLTVGKEAIGEVFKEFFASTPGVKSVSWDQYTPYFNDGDECVFGMHELCLHLDEDALVEDMRNFLADNQSSSESMREDQSTMIGLIAEKERPSYYKFDSITRTSLNEQEKLIATNFENLCKKLRRDELKDMYKMVFGDHVTVIATPDGVETEECEHD